MYRDEWLDTDRRPIALVSFEWAGKELDFHSSYVGILASTRDAEARLKRQLGEKKQHPESPLESAQTDRLWPAYREIHPRQPDYWDNLQAFRGEIVEEITKWWEHSWELIDLALRP